MASHIFLLLIRDPTLLQTGDNPGGGRLTAVRLIQAFKDVVRGDCLDIPFVGCINVLSVAHRVGYFETEDHRHLLNQMGGGIGDQAGPVAADYRANMWEDVMTDAAVNDPEFQAGAQNSRMYRKARGERDRLTRERDAVGEQMQDHLNRAGRLQQRGQQTLLRLQQAVRTAEQDYFRDFPLGRTQQDLLEQQRLTQARDRARQDLVDAQNPLGEVHTLQQQEQAARQQAQLVHQQLQQSLAQYNQDMLDARRQYSFRDFFEKTFLERQGMQMGAPNILPIHGNFFFKKRPDTATPQLALGCSTQQNFPFAFFFFVRRTGPGLGGMRNPFLIVGLGGIKIMHWEMEGINEENVALSYRNIAYGSLDSIADTNLPYVPSTRWFDRTNFHGSEGGWGAVMMAAFQTAIAVEGGILAATGAGDL
ncbi:MAG: type VI secretion system tube protein Hcp [Pirellulaceae bacterium]